MPLDSDEICWGKIVASNPTQKPSTTIYHYISIFIPLHMYIYINITTVNIYAYIQIYIDIII